MVLELGIGEGHLAVEPSIEVEYLVEELGIGEENLAFELGLEVCHRRCIKTSRMV